MSPACSLAELLSSTRRVRFAWCGARSGATRPLVYGIKSALAPCVTRLLDLAKDIQGGHMRFLFKDVPTAFRKPSTVLGLRFVASFFQRCHPNYSPALCEWSLSNAFTSAPKKLEPILSTRPQTSWRGFCRRPGLRKSQ
jgi:hypothetical protein